MEAAVGGSTKSILGAVDFVESGELKQLMEKYGYSAENIASRAKDIIEKKG